MSNQNVSPNNRTLLIILVVIVLIIAVFFLAGYFGVQDMALGVGFGILFGALCIALLKLFTLPI